MIIEKTLIQSPSFEKKLNNQAFIDSYLEDMRDIISRVSRERIDRIVELLFSAWKQGRTVFVMGNGGSASTATHFACDLAKCTIVEGKRGSGWSV